MSEVKDPIMEGVALEDTTETTSSEKTTTSTPEEPTTGEGEQESLIQLEPTQEEMERERLLAKAEQLQDDILRLREELQQKERELAEVKKELGITPFVEFKQSMAHGFHVIGDKWKEVQETETYRKIDEKLTSWKTKVEESESYQKTKSTLSEGSKKATDAISHAGTKIKESETVKTIGEKTSSAFKRTGTLIKDTGTAIKESETVKSVGTKISSAATTLKSKVMGSSIDQGDETPATEETLVPDVPPKNE